MAGRIEEQGRACIIVVNKWDLVEKNSSTIYQVEKELRSKLYFLHWSKMIFISALTGQRGKLLILQGLEERKMLSTVPNFLELIELLNRLIEVMFVF